MSGCAGDRGATLLAAVLIERRAAIGRRGDLGQRRVGELLRPRLPVGRAREGKYALSDSLEILDGRRRATGDTDHPRAAERSAIGQVRRALDLDDRLIRDLAEPRQLLGVSAVSATDH